MLALFRNVVGLKAWRAWFESDFQFSLLTINYLIWARRVNQGFPPVRILILVLSIGLYLAFGVLVNDYFDIDYDRRSGKKRTIYFVPRNILHLLQTVLLAASALLIVAISNPYYAILYGISVVLAIAYSAPKPRFKEKGALGLLVDVTIEKTFPTLLVLTFFNYFGLDAMVLVLLASCFHLEMIFRHQVEDYQHDKDTGIKTLVSEKLGPERAQHILDKYIRPPTAVLFLAFLLVLLTQSLHLLFIYLIMAAGYLLLKSKVAAAKVTLEDRFRPLYFAYVVVIDDNIIPVLLALLVLFYFPKYLFLVAITLLAQLERYRHFGLILRRAV